MLEIKHLSLTYGEAEKSLHDITFSVADGECALLTGKSGSGKSSIIRAINGIASSYDGASLEGEILIDGRAVEKMSMADLSQMIASVFQNPKTHFFNVDTTLELVFYLENIGLSREKMKERLEKMLALFHIEHLMDRDIFKLSGGEKQVLSIAAAYISGAPIILLDEPSSNLDEKTTRILHDMLYLLKREGITLVIAEHRLYYLMDLVDRIYLMEKGKLKTTFNKSAFLDLSEKALYAQGLRSTRPVELKNKSGNYNGSDLKIHCLQHFFEGSAKGFSVEDIGLVKGRVYGIVGTNGCGKSTFLRSLLGIEKSMKDDIEFKGIKMPKRKRLAHSALVMQDVNHQLFSDTVAGEVVLGQKAIDEEKREQILDRLNLLDKKERHPMSLSGGEKQRVAIASVLLSDREIIGFDEPTSGMDYENMVSISGLTRSLAKDERILIVVSHDTEFLNRTADEIIDMRSFGIQKN